jgi:hypothetical protein
MALNVALPEQTNEPLANRRSRHAHRCLELRNAEWTVLAHQIDYGCIRGCCGWHSITMLSTTILSDPRYLTSGYVKNKDADKSCYRNNLRQSG